MVGVGAILRAVKDSLGLFEPLQGLGMLAPYACLGKRHIIFEASKHNGDLRVYEDGETSVAYPEETVRSPRVVVQKHPKLPQTTALR